MPGSRRYLIIIVTVLFSLLILPGCSSVQTHTNLSMMPMSDMPTEVQNAAVSVREAYQFAAANPDLMKQIPCYCGCGEIGHTSNYSCYVSGMGGDGSITYDMHAIGCSICVDITRDVMRMARDGTSPVDMHASIDLIYSKYGISNIP